MKINVHLLESSDCLKIQKIEKKNQFFKLHILQGLGLHQ